MFARVAPLNVDLRCHDGRRGGLSRTRTSRTDRARIRDIPPPTWISADWACVANLYGRIILLQQRQYPCLTPPAP